MTHFVGRALAGALVGLSALAMSAQAQSVTNPLQKPAPANERGGQGDRGSAKDATSQQQPGLKQNERDANDSNQSGSQSGQTNRNTSSQQSGQNQNTQNQNAQNQNGSANNQSGAGRQNGASQQGSQQNSRDDRDTRRDSSSARERTAMKPTDMRGPDIGLWFNRGNRDGLVISDVSSHGPIVHLGFREGDRIVSVNGHRVSGESEFINYLLTGNDSRVEVIVTRDGHEETIYVEPAQFTEDYGTTQVEPLEQFGVVLDDRYNDRLVVWKVIQRSPAYYAGIREGDVITTVGGRNYATRSEFERGVGELKSGEANVQVRRGEKTRDLSVDVPEFERGAGNGGRGTSQQGDSRADDNHADNNRADSNGANANQSGQADRDRSGQSNAGSQNGSQPNAQPNSGQQSDSQQGVSPAKKATSGGWKEGR
jgi:C-terminal processing protease CtpA/Prc